MNDPDPITAPPNPTGLDASATGPDHCLLQAREVRKSFVIGRRTLPVLCGVSFQVQRGELLAMRGASGAGKSTLLHLLGGLDVPNAGQIWFDGRNLADLPGKSLAQFRNRRVGYVFQAYHLFPELDALENVCLPSRIARISSRQTEARARDLLARVGLGDRMEHKPFELSGGEQQRVAIARALVNHPELVLADEPTGNLDSQTGAEIIELLCTLRLERRTTLIIATHDTKVAERAPRILDLADGRIAEPE